jgi:hypothetical protein
MMNEEEVDDLVGLESSMTRMDGTVEAGVEGLSAPLAASTKTLRQRLLWRTLKRCIRGLGLMVLIFVILKVGCCAGSDVQACASKP